MATYTLNSDANSLWQFMTAQDSDKQQQGDDYAAAYAQHSVQGGKKLGLRAMVEGGISAGL